MAGDLRRRDAEELSMERRFLRLILQPVAFFDRLGLDTPFDRVLPYHALLVWSVAVFHPQGVLGMSGSSAALSMLLAPLGALAANALLAGLSHALGSIQGAGAELRETLKVYLYAFTPALPYLVVVHATGGAVLPIAPGAFVAGNLFAVDAVAAFFSAWWAVLVLIGLKEVHTIPTYRALIMALPAVLFVIITADPVALVTLWLGWV